MTLDEAKGCRLRLLPGSNLGNACHSSPAGSDAYQGKIGDSEDLGDAGTTSQFRGDNLGIPFWLLLWGSSQKYNRCGRVLKTNSSEFYQKLLSRCLLEGGGVS